MLFRPEFFSAARYTQKGTKKSKNAGDLHLIVLKEKEYKNLTLTTHTQTQRTHTKHAIAAKAQTH